MEMTKYPSGMFNWVDLATSDLDAARKYYGTLFGWTREDQPLPDGGVYVMAKIGGKAVAGMSTLPPGQENIPPHWNCYISVDDIEKTTAKAAGLGGTVAVPAIDVMGFGKMAVVSDPEGAVFCLWQPQAHIGAERVNETGAFCWNELFTRNPAAAGEFYSQLFGWKIQKDESVAPYVYVAYLDGREIGTMLEIQKDWGPMPAHWTVYFAVDHCEDWLARSGQLGGQTFMPPEDIPGVGRFAGVSDPQGARFQVIQLVERAGAGGA